MRGKQHLPEGRCFPKANDMKKKTASKETEKSSTVKENFPGQRQDDDRLGSLTRHHYYCISAEARAALRLAEVLREEFRARTVVAQMVRATMGQVAEASSMVASGKHLPTEGSLSLTEEACRVVVGDTAKARVVLRLFLEQVRALDESYLRAKGENPIAAFKALRDVSRELYVPWVTTAPEVDSSRAKQPLLWQYVLRAWETTNPEAARIARWHPGKGAREELKFDEASRTWRHVVSDGSTAAEAVVEVKTTFAVDE